jgi:hypothetical protein
LTIATDFQGEESDDFLAHYGIARRSGRYPWGSGDDPYQRSRQFKAYMDEMKSKGLTESEIAKGLTDYANRGITDPRQKITVKSTDLRGATSSATDYIFAENQARAYRFKEKNMSNVAIAKAMGTNESTVRGWLKQSQDIKEGSLRATANALKAELENKPFLDVGKGTELYLGVADSKLRSAISMLKDEGYKIHYMDAPQLGTDKQTKLRILTKGDKEWKDVNQARLEGRIQNVQSQSDDGGLSFRTAKELPTSINSKKLQVRYDEDGGTQMDGVIELRRGVEDLSLGDKRYAQVRIAVDGTHYLKGMAMYADDLPPGVDIRFNTNKKKTDPAIIKDGKLGALKPMKTVKDDQGNESIDPANPFGATTKPRLYTDKNGKEKQSPLNLVNEEGSWDAWSKSLSSQMLSKQPLSLASKQLAETQKRKRDELDSIMKMTNPVVRQKLLDEYADSTDAAAVHLKAAAMPKQSSHVILPMNSMRPNEIYAPNFKDGDRVALVRYPHGGPFEIPELTVNNRNAQAKRILGNAKDAVGIHHSVAEQLSGADFDGDSVLVIPNTDGKIKSRPPLAGLKTFDPKAEYKIAEGDTSTTRMTKKNTQTEMGKISNLITDMTIKGANASELERAVKHSMVVIDAEKHGLDYKRSERDNGISALKTEYQGGPRRGASTLISRASSTERIDRRIPRPAKDGGPIDPKTGKLVWVADPNAKYTKVTTKINKRTGETVEVVKEATRQTKGTKMEFADDARKLSSGTPMEEVYAAHANIMKDLANTARRESVALANGGLPRQNKAAKAVYSKEVASLEAKLREAQRNAPLERQAQILGNAMAKARIESRPDFDKDDIKKIKYQSLEEARIATGANKKKIGAPDAKGNSTLTDREWEAIQAGAFSSSRLKEILSNADMDRVKTLATPRARTSLTAGQMARAQQMLNSGRPMSEIAETLGLPRSTIVDNLNG